MLLIFAQLINDNLYMQRCLQLAERAKGMVFPNPMVGAVVVYDNKIIGEGYHQQYGGPHAEVNAINSVKNKELLKESTIYVNLEPCCHWGKTPPCSQLIIDSGIKKVIVGNVDPNPVVAGKGLKLLEEAGITVVSGILEQECLNLNLSFIKQFKHSNKTLKFILKWAQSADGFMGKEFYNSAEERELSNDLVKRFVHKLRSETQAIMIGTNTALTDNPLLDNRFWYGQAPIAVLIDKTLKIPLTHNLFKPDRKVVLFNTIKDETFGYITYIKINFDTTQFFWNTIAAKLNELGIHSVLLEGGSKTIQSFIDSGLPCDIIRISTLDIWKNGIKAPIINLNPTYKFNLEDNLVELFTI
jgi:diaminohydroxyphosphoribosylaminopyrimidine deaminase / 5-amino-6-(5-phosphoribosylamino)uracil reductase